MVDSSKDEKKPKNCYKCPHSTVGGMRASEMDRVGGKGKAIGRFLERRDHALPEMRQTLQPVILRIERGDRCHGACGDRGSIRKWRPTQGAALQRHPRTGERDHGASRIFSVKGKDK